MGAQKLFSGQRIPRGQFESPQTIFLGVDQHFFFHGVHRYGRDAVSLQNIVDERSYILPRRGICRFLVSCQAPYFYDPITRSSEQADTRVVKRTSRHMTFVVIAAAIQAPSLRCCCRRPGDQPPRWQFRRDSPQTHRAVVSASDDQGRVHSDGVEAARVNVARGSVLQRRHEALFSGLHAVKLAPLVPQYVGG